MKIKISQLRKIIREEVEKTLSQHKKDGWPDCNKQGCTGKMKPNPQSGNKTSLYCSKCGAEKKKAIKLESLSHTGSSPLKDGGVVNRDSGEILDMDSVPPQYLDHLEVDEMGYTTLPNDKFEELRGELKGSSAGKPKKQRLAPFQLNRESKGFNDYIRDVDRDMPTSWDSPDPQDVHDEFLKLRDYDGEVPLKMLAAGLGVEPNQIDWNGTGLRVINGVVTEVIGDTPYRTNR